MVCTSLVNLKWLGREPVESDHGDEWLPASPQYDFDYPPTLSDQSARPLSALVEDMLVSGQLPDVSKSVDDSQLFSTSLYPEELPELTQRSYQIQDDIGAQIVSKSNEEARSKAISEKLANYINDSGKSSEKQDLEE